MCGGVIVPTLNGCSTMDTTPPVSRLYSLKAAPKPGMEICSPASGCTTLSVGTPGPSMTPRTVHPTATTSPTCGLPKEAGRTAPTPACSRDACGFEQRFRSLDVGGGEPLGEAGVDRGQEITRRRSPSLLMP